MNDSDKELEDTLTSKQYIPFTYKNTSIGLQNHTIKEVRVMSEEECIRYSKSKDVKPCVIISINSNKNKPELNNNENIREVLTLFFDDITKKNIKLGSKNKLMTEDQGESIISFINQWKNQVEEIIVHCAAGISRSSAVASAISIYLGMDDMWIWDGFYSPNPHVFNIMNKYIELPKSEISKRYIINRIHSETADYGDILSIFDSRTLEKLDQELMDRLQELYLIHTLNNCGDPSYLKKIKDGLMLQGNLFDSSKFESFSDAETFLNCLKDKYPNREFKILKLPIEIFGKKPSCIIKKSE